MALREHELGGEDFQEAESTEQALGLMVSRLHPKKDVPAYLTLLKPREVNPGAALSTQAEVLREANMPTKATLLWLGIEEDAKYKIFLKVGTERKRRVEAGELIETVQAIYEEREVDARAYARHIIRTNRGIAQALVLGTHSKHLDNYRVSREGVGRRGGVSIATSMVTGKQETSMGLIGRFRRALGQR